MTPDRATLDFFNRFPEDVRAEGEKLHRDGAVTQIFGNHLFVRGRVDDQGDVYRTTLRFDNSRWFGGCDSGDALSPPVFATMLERLARGENLPDSPNEIGEESLYDLLENRLGRPLTEAENDFVTKLERRYRRYEMEQALFDHDLVRLHPRWPVDSYEPLHLWPVAPADILEFWNFVAYAFRKRRLSYPECMDAVTDVDETRERMAEWERQREVARWSGHIATVNRSLPEDSSRKISLRLLVTMNRARLQIRDLSRDPETSPGPPLPNSPLEPALPPPPSTGHFKNLAKGEFADLESDFHVGNLDLDDASALLLSELIAARGDDSPQDFDLPLEDEENCALLARLLHHQLLDDRIVTLDEQPIVRRPDPLRWRCDPPISPATSAPFRIQLETADGEDIPHSLRALPGRITLYLSDETVFPGPQNWTGGTEVQPSYDIPPEVLDCDAGVEFLGRIGASPPAGIRERLREVLMGVRMELSLTKKITGTESEHLFVKVTAADADGIRNERLSKDGWELSSQKSPDEGGLIRFDRSLLHRFPSALEPMSLTYEPHLEAFKTRVTKAFPARFTEWLASVPKAVEIISDPALRSLGSAAVEASVRFEVEGTDIDWFDLKIVVDIDGHDLTQEEIRALVAARGDFVRMDNGGWLRLQMKLDKEQAEAVAHLGLDIFDLSGEKHRMHVLQLSDPKAKEVFDKDAWEEISNRAASLKLQVRPALPSGLKLDLRPYQVEGFHFLAYLASNRFGGILADDMGLGKTVQAITWLLWLRDKNGQPTSAPSASIGPQADLTPVRPVLIVCPKSVLDVWAGEVRKFAPELRVQVLRNKEELDIETVKSSVDLLVVNYAQLRVCAEPLTSISWLACVLDEGQQIKNPDSKAAQTAREITADHRLVLTGTPIENRLLDVWSLMAFSMPGVLGDRAYFRKRFDRRKDPNSQVRLAARLRPFLLRRTKRQVALDLPPRTEEDVFCKLEGSQDELYKAELERIQRILLGIDGTSGLRKNRFAILQGLMRLRQICCHPDLIDSGGDGESAKMTALFYLLDQLKEEGHKVLVFSQFVTMLDIIKDRLEEENRPYHYLTGQTQNRHEVVSDFQSTDDASVFLLSLKAGGSGLNLTAASYVVLYDPWWNPAVENQAIDRTHRIGQNNPVIAYRLLMRDTVEEKIRLLQTQKQAMAEGVLGEEGFASNLKLEELKFLFGIEGD